MRKWLLCLLSLPVLAQPPEGPSFIAVPIHVDLTPLLATIERNTPSVPPGVETWINLPGTTLGSPAYRFNLYRDPLYFNVTGQHVVVRTTVNYWLEVGLRMKDWVKGMASCGRAPERFRRARLGVGADISLRPDWRLSLKLTPEEPQRLDSCEVSFVGYDITDKVLGGIKGSLFQACQTLEQQLQESQLLRQRVEAAWLQAQQPVEVAPDVFLALNPEGIRLAPWTSQGKEITITPELQVHPTLTLGPRPQLAPRPLPNLDTSPLTIQPGFRMQVEAALGFAQADVQLAKQVVGKVFETEKGKFEIQRIHLHSRQGLLLLEVALKGRIDGNLTLVGRPFYDPQSGSLQLADLDYTLESKSWITQFGEWLYRGTLRKTLADQCGKLLDASFKNLRVQAQQGMNRSLSPELAMTGQMDSLALSQVEVLEDRFRIVAQLAGQVQIAVKTAP